MDVRRRRLLAVAVATAVVLPVPILAVAAPPRPLTPVHGAYIDNTDIHALMLRAFGIR